MADNVTLPGTGTVVAADDVSGVWYQRVKLVNGTLDATDAIGGDATNGLDVDVTRLRPDGTNTMPAMDAAARRGYVQITDGTNSASVTSTGALFVGGAVAHDDTDTGNPLKLGAKAVSHGINPTAVAAGDRTDLYANRAGILFTIGGHPNIVTYGHSAITTAVTDSALITVSSGTRIVVTRLSISLDSASTVFPAVRIGFGTANVPAAGNSGILFAHGGFPAGGAMTIGSGSGIIAVGGDDADLRITTTGNATGNGLLVSVSYFTIST